MRPRTGSQVGAWGRTAAAFICRSVSLALERPGVRAERPGSSGQVPLGLNSSVAAPPPAEHPMGLVRQPSALEINQSRLTNTLGLQRVASY